MVSERATGPVPPLDGNLRTKSLLKTAAPPYQHNVKMLLNDSSLLSRLRELAREKGIEFKQLRG